MKFIIIFAAWRKSRNTGRKKLFQGSTWRQVTFTSVALKWRKVWNYFIFLLSLQSLQPLVAFGLSYN